MRNYFNKSVYALLLSVIMLTLSCKKQEDADLRKVQEQEVVFRKGLTVKDGMLAFSSLSIYDNLLEQTTSKDAEVRKYAIPEFKGFVSRQAFQKSAAFKNAKANEAQLIDNETLNRILNKDGMIIIDKWILKINVEKEVVTVLEVANNTKENYEDLVNDRSNALIYSFSTDYDVLDLLMDGYKSVPNEANKGVTAFLCGGGTRRGTTEDVETIDFNPFTNSSYIPMVGFNAYEKYGIYFEAYTKVRTNDAYPFNMNAVTDFKQFAVTYYYKTNCKKFSEGRESFSNREFTFAFDDIQGDWDEKFKFYASSRGLNRLELDSRWSIRVLNTPAYSLVSKGIVDIVPPPLRLD
jgi:hypothetical protein